VPATFFINSDRLNAEHERWWDILERIFLSEPALPPVLDVTVGGQDLRMPTATAAERSDALTRLNRTAWPLDANARRQLVGDVKAWSGADGSPRATHRVVTGDEVRALASRPGHAVGSHTMHHLALTAQPMDTKRREVFEDKAALERLLQQRVRLFSYPYGDVDAETLTVVNSAGFLAAVTVEARLVSAGTNRLLLPRYEITTADQGRFPLRLREIFS